MDTLKADPASSDLHLFPLVLPCFGASGPGFEAPTWILTSSLGFGLMTDVETCTEIKGPESCRRNVCPGSSLRQACNEQKPHFSLVLYEAGNLLIKSFN